MISPLSIVDPTAEKQIGSRSRLVKEPSLFYITDAASREDAISRIAGCWTIALRGRPRLSIFEADRDYILLDVRKFLGGIPKEVFQNRQVALLASELFAAKLGIRAELFDSHPGFEKFARENHLHRYLLTYCQGNAPGPLSRNNAHRWTVDPDEIKILSGGIVKTWSEASKDLKTVASRAGHPKMSWHYGPSGIQNKDYYNWDILEPFLKRDPSEWGHQYLFEVCVCTSEYPNFIGDHTWLRLKTPQGDVYSVGLYRPGKVNPQENYQQPLRVKPAYLMSPDYSEFYPCETHTLGIAITPEIFCQIKSQIEEDKKSILEFHPLVKNCTVYTLKHAKTAGLELPAQSSALQVLLRRSEARKVIPLPLQMIVKSVIDRMPAPVQTGCKFFPSLFLNGVQIALGSGKVDDRLRRRPDGEISLPHMNSFWDFFKPAKLDMHHPHILYKVGFAHVKNWRDKKSQKLQARRDGLNCALKEMERAGRKASDTAWIRAEIYRFEEKMKQIPYRFPKIAQAKL
jgi:hypothetical protein